MVLKSFQNLVRGDVKGNLANRFRKKRILLFHSFLKRNNLSTCSILDLGGTQYFWDAIEYNHHGKHKITLLNIEFPYKMNENYNYKEKDVRDLSQSDFTSFDVIFSNSFIEHLNNFEDQKRLAELIIASNKPFYIQTPNYFFPFEPHFLFPFFQFFPIVLKVWLIQKFNIGWFNQEPDKSTAFEIAYSIKLLSKKELKSLFPNAIINHERFFFLTKSFIVTSN